jgi:hypothetical protein
MCPSWGHAGGGRVWVIWVIGGWNMSAVVVEKSTRDRCVDAGRRDECRGGWVTRDGTGDVDARVASRGSFGRERGGRASVVCVCVCVWDSSARRASGRRVRARVGGSDSDSSNESASYRSIAGARRGRSRARGRWRRARIIGAPRARRRA